MFFFTPIIQEDKDLKLTFLRMENYFYILCDRKLEQFHFFGVDEKSDIVNMEYMLCKLNEILNHQPKNVTKQWLEENNFIKNIQSKVEETFQNFKNEKFKLKLQEEQKEEERNAKIFQLEMQLIQKDMQYREEVRELEEKYSK